MKVVFRGTHNIVLKLVTFGPLIFIPLVVGISYFFSIEMYSQSFLSNINRIEKNLIEDEKSSVKNKVLNISDMVVYQQSVINESITSRIKNRVEEAYKTADNIYQNYKN